MPGHFPPQPPVEYLNRYRLDKSLALLRESDRSITEIALAVGFGRASYYAEIFRRHLSQSPTEYRAKARSGSWALQGNDFSFALYDNADCTGTPLRTATNTGDGSITFDALTFDAAGEYTYYLREIPGDRTAITYDTAVYKVVVSVTDNGTGALSALTQVYTLDDEAMGAAEFVNTYTATPGDDTFTLTINKLLNGRAMNADEFSFELTDETGALVSTGTNAADGTVTFTPVGLKAAQAQYAAFLASQPVAAEPEATAAPEATAEPSAAPEATAEPEASAEPEPTAQPEAAAKPKQTPAPASTAQPAAAAQSSPRTGDNASLMTWVGILLVCGAALAGLYVYKKRKQK